MNNTWIDKSGMLIRIPQEHMNEPPFLYYEKVAGFNFDYTLIKPKDSDDGSPNTIYKSYDDWNLYHSKLLSKIIKLHTEKHSIVIFSNQDITKTQTREDVKNRFDDFIKLFYKKRIPIIGMFSLENNVCRKPHTGMWKLLDLLYKHNRFDPPKEELSLYIGNLAGRKYTRQGSRHGKNNRDISHIDRAFAYNTRLKFYTPEMFLFKKAPRPWMYPISVLSRDETINIRTESRKLEFVDPFRKGVMHYFKKHFKNIKQFLVIIVGPPTSTKTATSKKIVHRTAKYIKKGWLKPWYIIDIKSFGRINKNTINKCAKKLSEEITHGNSVIVDGTNETTESRKIIIDIVKNFTDIGIIILDLQVAINIAKHLNDVKIEIFNKFKLNRIKNTVFTKFIKNFKKPTKEEFDKLDISTNRYRIIEYPFILIEVKEWWYIYDKL